MKLQHVLLIVLLLTLGITTFAVRGPKEPNEIEALNPNSQAGTTAPNSNANPSVSQSNGESSSPVSSQNVGSSQQQQSSGNNKKEDSFNRDSSSNKSVSSGDEKKSSNDLKGIDKEKEDKETNSEDDTATSSKKTPSNLIYVAIAGVGILVFVIGAAIGFRHHRTETVELVVQDEVKLAPFSMKNPTPEEIDIEERKVNADEKQQEPKNIHLYVVVPPELTL